MTSYIRERMKKIKKEEKDLYGTKNYTLTEKIAFYDNKIKDLVKIKNDHKNELQNLKSLKTSSINVLQFKLDEMAKKMRSEINRLKQEESRHEESQGNESKRIKAQINFLKENNEQLTEVLDEFLERVVTLEQNLGM